MEEQFVVLIDGKVRSTTSQGGIRTYKTVDRAIKESNKFRNYPHWKDRKFEVAKVKFEIVEEI